ncbi:MAG: Rha family transcriptional regulator [Thiomargarita sp.]|nr:Rha family transcriptional regulator [Thiomargarita sp.]
MKTDLSKVIGCTMTTLEISRITNTKHANVMRAANTLADKGIITVSQIEIPYKSNNGAIRQHKIYKLSKTESINLVARLSPEFTAAIIDRWQALETQKRDVIPPQLRRFIERKKTIPFHHFIALEVITLELTLPLHDNGVDLFKHMMPEGSFVKSWNKVLRKNGEVIENFPTHEVQTEHDITVSERCYPSRLRNDADIHFWGTWLPTEAPKYLLPRQYQAMPTLVKAFPTLHDKLQTYRPRLPIPQSTFLFA